MLLELDIYLVEFLKLSSQKLFFVSITVFFMAGCSILNPYIDRRRNPGAQSQQELYSGPSTPENPVVCYNPLYSNENELKAVADAECQKQQTGDEAEFVKKTRFDGKLLLPYHAHYKCVKKGTENK